MGNISAPMPPMLPAQAGGTSFPARLAPLAGSQSVPLALPAGARVVAEVVQTQTDGQVLLRLGQTLLAAQLPGQHQVGDQLPLIVLSEPGTQPALLMAPQSGTPAAQPELSTTGQWLARLQQQAAPALRAPEPLWPQPDGNASPRLAQALASSVRESGLFYESHLAAWVQGELPTEALLQEPQGRLSSPAPAPLPDPAGPQTPGGTAQPAGTAPAAAPSGGPADAQAGAAHDAVAAGQPGRVAQDVAAPHAAAAGTQPTAAGVPGAAPGAPATAAPPPHPHAAAGLYASVQVQTGTSAAALNPAGAQAMPAQLQALVQQQLATLAQGVVVWAGQAWPGQDLEWRIEQDDAQASQGDAAAPARAWTSVLRLDLPRLGQLVVTLQLSSPSAPAAGQHLRVRLEHASGAAAALHARGAEFRQALQDAGLQLDELALRPLGGEQHV